jgi:hypothetical protein
MIFNFIYNISSIFKSEILLLFFIKNSLIYGGLYIYFDTLCEIIAKIFSSIRKRWNFLDDYFYKQQNSIKIILWSFL